MLHSPVMSSITVNTQPNYFKCLHKIHFTKSFFKKISKILAILPISNNEESENGSFE